jgi:hypothetical protein
MAGRERASSISESGKIDIFIFFLFLFFFFEGVYRPTEAVNCSSAPEPTRIRDVNADVKEGSDDAKPFSYGVGNIGSAAPGEAGVEEAERGFVISFDFFVFLLIFVVF